MEATGTIFLIDIQSFYASVEIAANPQLTGKPVVVCGDPVKRHGITLAASPEAKKTGIKTGMPVWQVKNLCPNANFVKPHMQKYINASIEITEILKQFTDKVEVYSIDEQFIDVTNSKLLFGEVKYIAKMIQQRIWDEVGVLARVGIGENKIQAKMACDQFAKKNKEGLFNLNYDNYKKLTGPLTMDKLFGVGRRMKHNLGKIGIYTIKDLADRPLPEITKRWGIMGHVLWLSAQGIDYSPVETDSTLLYKGIGNSITLPKDYTKQGDIEVVLLEIIEEVCQRARFINKKGKTIHVSIKGTDFDHPTGFYRQDTLSYPSNDTIEIYHKALEIFTRYWDRNPVRSIGVSLSNLEETSPVQLAFFSDPLKKIKLGKIMDGIRGRYGKTAIFRASSLLPSALLFDRAVKIGGHDA